MKLFATPLLVSALFGISAMTAAAQSPSQDTEQPAGNIADAPPAAEDTVLPARLSDVEGTVRVARIKPAAAGQMPPVGQAFRTATVNTPVLAGTEVDTGNDGRAELQFNDGNIARITPNSAVLVVKLPSGGEELRALRGLSYFEAPDSGTGVMTVAAGPVGVRLDQNSLLRLDLDETPYRIAALRGSAHVSSPTSDVGFEITNGQTAKIDPAAAGSYDVTQDVADDSWDAWNTDRDQTLAQLAESQTNARVGNGDADSPAWNDLDYYGTWYDVPGAGMAWAPDGVDADFDPYGAGAWTSYPGVGLTWVSAYPWGWLPYHCGGWSYFQSFGWGWQPGRACGGYGAGVGWYPYTGIHNAPRDYRIPLPLDSRLRTRLTGTPMPHPRAVIVNRAPVYHFRSLGGARPQPRAFRLGNNIAEGGGSNIAPTLPVGAGFAGGRGVYQPLVGAPGVAGYGSGLRTNHIEGGRVFYTPQAGAITPPPHVLAAPRNAIAPPPRVLAPPVIRNAPTAPVAVPRVEAPRAAPRGH